MKKDVRNVLFWSLFAVLLFTLLPLAAACSGLFRDVNSPLAEVVTDILPFLPPILLGEVLLGGILWAVFCRGGERKAVLTVLRQAQAYLADGKPMQADEKAPGLAGELAGTCNRLAEQLQAADATRADFMSNVSHDLKTPMTVIQGYAENILNGSISRQEEPRYLEQMIRETKRLSGLVGIYQEVSRIDAGDWTFASVPFDFPAKLRETVGIFVDRFEQKHLNGDLDCPEEPVLVRGDEEAIGRVLYCLLDNAVKFTPDGGTVNISLRPVGTALEFSIYNEGKGISREDLPYIFDRSFKADRSRGVEKDSFGLGLYLCKRILSYHSAEIRAESEEGSFCRFTFSLPVSAH